jgi:hypothetical protein
MEKTTYMRLEEMMIREIALRVEEEANEKHQHHHLPAAKTAATNTPLVSFCPHAVAVGSTVYGLSADFEVGQEQVQASLSWLSSASWTTCLATKKPNDDDCHQAIEKEEEEKAVSSHHVISQIVSNDNGSIIAISSQQAAEQNDGTVSVLVTLLRGSDGQVLVTRQVASISLAETDTAATAARLSFVGDTCSSTRGGGPNCLDTLLIHVPGGAAGGHGQLITVSGIHGQALNDGNREIVQQATRSMKVRAIKLPTATNSTSCDEHNQEKMENESHQHHHQSSSIPTITGFFLHQSTNFAADNDMESQQDSRMIRLVACDSAGSLTVYDHNPSTKTCTLVQSDIVLQLDGQSWKVDYNVGLIQQKTVAGGMEMYLVCAAVSGSRLAVAWFDPMSLKSVCHSPIETTSSPAPHSNNIIAGSSSSGSSLPVNRSADKSSSSRSRRLKVLSIQPIKSCLDDSALAVAVAVRGAAGGGGGTLADTTIHVLQAVVEDTMGLTILCKPHSVFEIPGHSSHEQTLCASLSPCIGNVAAPYSFLFQQRSVSGGTTCIAFCPPQKTSQVVGLVRLLLEEGNFEKASEILKAAGIDSSISVPYATFHPSDVALQQLLHVGPVGHGDVHVQVQKYLDPLVAGAKSGSEEQLNTLITSVNVIMNSFDEAVTADNNVKILSVLKSAIENSISVLPPSSKMAMALDQKMEMIDGRLKVMQFLSTKDGKIVVGALTTPLSKIQNPANLLTALVKERKFKQAADVWRSGLHSHILPEVLVTAMLQISADVPPAEYIGLLHDVAMPSLTINHELLPPLRAWCCRIADALDEKSDDKRNLDAAITLLEVRESRRDIFSDYNDVVTGCFLTPSFPKHCNLSFFCRLFMYRQKNCSFVSIHRFRPLLLLWRTRTERPDDLLGVVPLTPKHPEQTFIWNRPGGVVRILQVHVQSLLCYRWPV